MASLRDAAMTSKAWPFEEAANNLKLCRKLLAGQSKDGAAALKVATSCAGSPSSAARAPSRT